MKSHVSLERHLCLVCGKSYDTGAVLLQRDLRPTLDPHTLTGWGLCPEHQQLFDEGFVALVECDPEKSGQPTAGDRLPPGQAFRTGRIAHLRREKCLEVFNVPIPTDLPAVFVEPGVIEKLTARLPPDAKEKGPA